jgi:hypothetical protein
MHKLMYAKAGPFSAISNEPSSLIDPDRWVWIVAWRGAFPLRGCPAAPPDATPYPCPVAVSGIQEIVLDFTTGEGLIRRSGAKDPAS